jgi:hypothetical protein
MGERYYTVKEAVAEFFQGKVSDREVYVLFSRVNCSASGWGSARGKS